MAGKTIADLTARLPVSAVVRAMPNTPAAVGRGITGAFASAGVTEPSARRRMHCWPASDRSSGCASEDLIDAVTAVSGSGPAYVFHLTECLAEAAGGRLERRHGRAGTGHGARAPAP